jgi:hypothetical protein
MKAQQKDSAVPKIVDELHAFSKKVRESLRAVFEGLMTFRTPIRTMSAEPQRTCPSCGNEFSAEMEFCPVCML